MSIFAGSAECQIQKDFQIAPLPFFKLHHYLEVT
jgi:hypothetical protein